MDDIINYTMENPDNTNPNVLRGMLESYSRGGGALVVNVTVGEGNHFIMDKTAGDVYAAAQTGLVIVHYMYIYTPLIYAEYRSKSSTYKFYIVAASDWAPGVFTAAESTDYPTS